MANTVSKIITDDQLDRIIQIESGGNPNAKAPTSSATGLGQFLDATWLGVVTKHRPDLFQGRSRSEVLALRRDPKSAIELLARFTEDNAAVMGSKLDGDLYLAHFAGAGTARRLVAADQNIQASGIFGPEAVKANRSILAGKTVGQVRAWAARKMAQSGGHGWVAKYYGKTNSPAVEKAKDAAAAGGAVIATGTVVTAVNQGWPLWAWGLVGLLIVAAVVGGIFLLKHLRSRRSEAVASQADDAGTLVRIEDKPATPLLDAAEMQAAAPPLDAPADEPQAYSEGEPVR